jgi:hypothetical protein
VLSPLHIGVLASGAWTLIVLGALHARARAWGRRELFAPAAGDPRQAVVYAFGRGMWPDAKESARENLPTWFAGVGYHLGIFAGLGYVALVLAGVEPGGALRRGFQVALLAGALCGTGLLVKRVVTPRLRGLSCPDDFLSNLLTTAFTGLAFARTVSVGLGGIFLAETILLLLWLPLGKIRHCLFFFTTRHHMAVHFGRRGAYPPGTRAAGTFPAGTVPPGA